jgi:aminobenzoyl-glutamate transport protein
MAQKRSFFLRTLDGIERVGNKLPDPITLFALFAIGVVIISWIATRAGVSAVHPATQATIEAVNLLSAEGIRRMLTEAVRNFTAFPPLGLVIVVILGIGVTERSGLIAVSLKRLVSAVPESLLTATLVFGGIMSSMAVDAGYVVLTPLGALLFASIGRHPLAGLAAAFAGVSAGFSANLFLTSLDPLLSGLSTEAARLVDPNYTVQPTANYYFMIASVFMLTALGTFVTHRYVEPRLGKWTPPPGSAAAAGLDADVLAPVSPEERRGLRAAGIVFVLTLALMAWMVVPTDGILRGPEGELTPFYASIVSLLMLLFLFTGIAYGIAARTIRSDKDVANMMAESVAILGAYIVLAFMAAQFVAYFNWSNLGLILAINGANGLNAVGFTGLPLIISFVIVAGFINLFIGSASAKWAVMAPVFIPMLMLMGYSPELVQAAYRVGDSTTNIITPLMQYFPVIIAFAQKYDPRAGIGTLISAMLPYSIVFMIGWLIMLSIWMLAGIPLGPDAPMHYVPATP